MNIWERARSTELGRQEATRLREAGLIKAALALERLLKREEFALVDLIFDRASDFEKAMGDIEAAAGASPAEAQKLSERIKAMEAEVDS